MAERARISLDAGVPFPETHPASVRLYFVRCDAACARALGPHASPDSVFRDLRRGARRLRSIAIAAVVLPIFFPAAGNCTRVAQRLPPDRGQHLFLERRAET